MNTAFLKSVFSVEAFAKDYKRFLSKNYHNFRNFSKLIFKR